MAESMELKSTFRSEEKVDLTFESFTRSAVEALNVMFTPVRAIVALIKWRRWSTQANVPNEAIHRVPFKN